MAGRPIEQSGSALGGPRYDGIPVEMLTIEQAKERCEHDMAFLQAAGAFVKDTFGHFAGPGEMDRNLRPARELWQEYRERHRKLDAGILPCQTDHGSETD